MSGRDGISPSGSFDADTAVHATGPFRFRCELHHRWWGPIGPHGGYLAALLLRACTAAAGSERAPVHLSVRFCRPPSPGGAVIDVVATHVGRRHSVLEAQLTVEGAVIASASAVVGEPRDGLRYQSIDPPVRPAVDSCDTWVNNSWASPVLGRYLARPTEPIALFQGAADAQTTCWLRLVEDHPLDPYTLAFLGDAWIPPIFLALDQPVTLAPTLTYSLWFGEHGGARPSNWVLGAFRTEHARSGYVIEDGALWSTDGDLLVKLQQVAVVVT